MNIVILDDYQDVVRKLDCAEKLANYPPKVYTNTVKATMSAPSIVPRFSTRTKSKKRLPKR